VRDARDLTERDLGRSREERYHGAVDERPDREDNKQDRKLLDRNVDSFLLDGEKE
jgi:hypothetical protein